MKFPSLYSIKSYPLKVIYVVSILLIMIVFPILLIGFMFSKNAFLSMDNWRLLLTIYAFSMTIFALGAAVLGIGVSFSFGNDVNKKFREDRFRKRLKVILSISALLLGFGTVSFIAGWEASNSMRDLLEGEKYYSGKCFVESGFRGRESLRLDDGKYTRIQISGLDEAVLGGDRVYVKDINENLKSCNSSIDVVYLSYNNVALRLSNSD